MIPDATDYSNGPPWQTAAQAADDIARRVPDGYGGLVVNHQAQTAEIYIVRGFETLARQALAAADPCGRVFWVERSYATLVATRDRIANAMAWLAGIGLQPSGWGPDVRTNEVWVNVPSFTAAQQELVRGRFGSFVRLQQSNEHLVSI